MRISPKSALLIAVAVASCAGPPGSHAALTGAAPASASRDRCFTPRQVTNFAAIDDKTVNIRVGVERVYSLELLGACPDVDWNNTLAIRATGGGSFICTGLDATVSTRGPTGRQSCAVRAIHQLTPEEIAALPPRARP